MSGVGPPRGAERLLGLALPSADRDPVLGDLAEEFAARAERAGPGAAGRWYRRQVLRSLVPALARRLRRRREGDMREIEREVARLTRGLARTPAFTALAGLTLALGIGSSAAIFTVVDSVVLRPLGYPEPERLVRLDHPVPGQGPEVRWGLSVAGYFHFRQEATALEELGAYYTTSVNLTGDGPPERLSAGIVTASLFEALGARAAVGRLAGPTDDAPDAPPVVMLSHGLWERRFGADPDVVGRSVQLAGRPVPVIGVLEAGFGLPGLDLDLWLPSTLDPAAPAVNSHYLSVIGRLAPGATVEGARSELERLTARLPLVFPEAYDDGFMRSSRFQAGLRPLKETVLGGVDRTLWIVLAGVGLVLLIALANVANLFLVRGEGRVREVAIRKALGADRGWLAKHYVGESLLLAGAAGLVGVLLARLAVGALVALAPPDLPRLDEVALGAGTLLVTAVLVVASGLLLGLLPLWRGGASTPASALSEGGRGAATGRSGRVRSALVVAQVALALVLVTASGLMLRTFAHLTAVDPGFDADGLVVFDLSLPTSRYTDADAVYGAHRELLTRLEATPGVDAVGAANGVPILGGGFCVAVSFEDATTGEAVSRGCPEVRFVSPGYFEAMGIRLEEGRTFEHADNDSRAAPLVVSRAMAEQLWPGLDALGRGARLWGEGYFRVVGVVGDVRGAGLTDPVTPTLYYPLRPPPGESMPGLNAMRYVVRADAGTAVAGTLREVVGAFDPDLPVASVRVMDEVVGRSMIRTTFMLLLMGIAGSLALGLALVGLYGVVAYTVSRRTPEIGIRMALGASAGRVRAAVLGHAAALVLVGAVLGIGLARAATSFLAAGLHGVSANDPLTFAAAAGTLILVALLAAWLPARRATRIDPSSALRAE